MSKTKTMEFEKSLKRLERIVKDLEKGDLTLDEALRKYEEGIEFAKGCSKMLKEAKTKVERLIKKEGTMASEEFQLTENEDVS